MTMNAYQNALTWGFITLLCWVASIGITELGVILWRRISRWWLMGPGWNRWGHEKFLRETGQWPPVPPTSSEPGEVILWARGLGANTDQVVGYTGVTTQQQAERRARPVIYGIDFSEPGLIVDAQGVVRDQDGNVLFVPDDGTWDRPVPPDQLRAKATTPALNPDFPRLIDLEN